MKITSRQVGLFSWYYTSMKRSSLGLCLIVMSGLPGTGKSTLATVISKATHLPLISPDVIKESLIKDGKLSDYRDGSLTWQVATREAEKQLRQGSSIIIDAINAEAAAKETWITLASRLHAQIIVIECYVSDSVIHKSRIKNRKKNLIGIPEVDWDWVENRRLAYTHWNIPVLRIDGLTPIDESAKTVLSYIYSQ